MHKLPHNYRMTLNYTGNMEGSLHTENQTDIKLSAPPEFDGPGTGWSPETLFLSSISGCMALTFAAIAKGSKVEYSDLTLAVEGVVDAMADKRMHFSEIKVKPRLKLANPADESKMPRMWESVEKHCLVSNSVQTPVKIEAPEII